MRRPDGAVVMGAVLCSAVPVLRYIEHLGRPAQPGRFLANLAFCAAATVILVSTARRAGIAVRAGRRPAMIYGIGLATAVLAGILTLAAMPAVLRLLGLDLPAVYERRGHVASIISDGANIIALGGVALLLHYRRSVLAATLARIRGAELMRQLREREAANAQLALANARLEPQSVVAALGAVREAYGRDSAAADAALDRLIDELRARSRAVRVGGSST